MATSYFIFSFFFSFFPCHCYNNTNLVRVTCEFSCRRLFNEALCNFNSFLYESSLKKVVSDYFFNVKYQDLCATINVTGFFNISC